MYRLLSLASLLATAAAAGTWIKGDGWDASGWVRTYPGSPSYVCQYQGVAGFRPYYWSSECDVVINGTAVRGAGVPDVLKLEEGLAWGSTVPSDAFSVTTPSTQLTKVCRAYRLGSTSGAMFVGTVGYVNRTIACTYFASAVKVETNPSFQYLFVLPSDSPTWDINPPSPVVPSASPSPSVTPTISASSSPAVMGQINWVNASHHTSGFYIAAELAGVEGRSDIYVCRGVVSSTGEMILGKWETAWDFCDVPLVGADGQEVELPDSEYSILQRSPWLVWSKDQPRNADGSPSATAVVGGVYRGQEQIVCRAYHPFYRSGPHPGFFVVNGTFDGMKQPACLFSYGGGVVHASDFDLLYLYSSMPTVAVDNGFGNGTTVVTASYVPTPSTQAGLPSFTPTTTGTPSPSPSSGPVVPGVLQWWTPQTSLKGVGSQVVGMEGSLLVTVCRGRNPFSTLTTEQEWVPGKYQPGFSFCNIPLGNKEFNAREYQMLRENPWLRWDSGVNVNATKVEGGSLFGQPLTICRAKMQDENGVSLIGAGDHSGWTDGELYNGKRLCFIPFGGKVLRFTSFEVLQMIKSEAAVAFYTPSASYSPSPTNSVSASRTSTPSSSFSNTTVTASVSATGSVSISMSASQSPAASVAVVVVVGSQNATAAASVPATSSASSSPAAVVAATSPAAPSPSASASPSPASASATASASQVSASKTGSALPTGTRTGSKTPVPTGTPTTVFSASAAATPSSSSKPAQGGTTTGGTTTGGATGGGSNTGGSTDSGSGSGGSTGGSGSGSGSGGSGNVPVPSVGPSIAAAAVATGSFYDGSDAGSVFAAVFASLVAMFAAIGGFMVWKEKKARTAHIPLTDSSSPAVPSSPAAAAASGAGAGAGAAASHSDRAPLTQDARYNYPRPVGNGGSAAGVSV